MTEETQLRPITPGAACVATLCAALWGGLAVAIRYTQEDLPPFCTAGLRFALASLFMAVWAKREGASLWPAAGEASRLVVAGLLLYAQIGTFHWGLTQTNSSHASVLIGAHPVIVALLAHFLLPGDRLTWIKSCGLLLASAGLVLVVGGDRGRSSTAHDPATLAGDAVVFTSSLLLGISLVYTKVLLRRMPAGKILFWSYALATVGFLGTSVAIEPLAEARLTPASFWGLMYQSVLVAGFCFAAWTALLRRHRASQLVVFAFGQPLFGMLFGNWFRHDPLSVWLALGGAAIAVGILLVTRRGAADEAAR
jgi:drug/metabolite transporter (DMT)-like permease